MQLFGIPYLWSKEECFYFHKVLDLNLSTSLMILLELNWRTTNFTVFSARTKNFDLSSDTIFVIGNSISSEVSANTCLLRRFLVLIIPRSLRFLWLLRKIMTFRLHLHGVTSTLHRFSLYRGKASSHITAT